MGQTTSGGYGHFCGKSLAVGWIEADPCDGVTHYEIGLFGDRVPAVALEKAPFDPDDTRLRA